MLLLRARAGVVMTHQHAIQAKLLRGNSLHTIWLLPWGHINREKTTIFAVRRIVKGDFSPRRDETFRLLSQ
jgi:hypothetical protein